MIACLRIDAIIVNFAHVTMSAGLVVITTLFSFLAHVAAFHCQSLAKQRVARTYARMALRRDWSGTSAVTILVDLCHNMKGHF